MNIPNVTITFPNDLVSDFLGTFALDVMHDSKGRGILKNQKLATLTDLFSMVVLFNNQECPSENGIKNWVFRETLYYLTRLWSDNLNALGLTVDNVPNFHRSSTDNVYWNKYRKLVCLPLRSVADRDDEDTFVSLGRNKKCAETQNYYDQKELLKSARGRKLLLDFISPEIPDEYYQRAQTVVSELQGTLTETCRVVLDMKSSAGLLRTITDPIGYVTGLPTYTDPGYNMPGMSAIRQYSQVSFVEEKPTEFNYLIKLSSEFGELVFANVQYFYGNTTNSIPQRGDAMINVNGELFIGTLPKASMMAAKLAEYFNPGPQFLTMTAGELLNTLHTVLKNFSEPQNPMINEFRALHCNPNTNPQDLAKRTCVAATINNCRMYSMPKSKCLKKLITTVLPQLLHEYMTNKKDLKQLAFCYHQLEIIQRYLTYPGVSEPELAQQLNSQRLPGRKGKLVTQINKLTLEWRQRQRRELEEYRSYIIGYLRQLVEHCKIQIEMFSGDIDPDAKVLSELPALPPIETDLLTVLADHLQFYQPQFTSPRENTNSLVIALLDTVLWKKPLLTLSMNLQEDVTLVISPENPNYKRDELVLETVRYVLGKFSGDFGQVAWSMCNGYVFASEDNNTSAMALLLHRLVTERKWASIHGWGDGSRVDVTFG